MTKSQVNLRWLSMSKQVPISCFQVQAFRAGGSFSTAVMNAGFRSNVVHQPP